MAARLSGAAVLFDLDGTLVDTADDLAASMNHALAGSGLAPVPAGEVRNLVGRGARRMLMRGYEVSAGREADEKELDAALARFLTHYQANIAVASRPFGGVIEMIEELRAEGMRIAICTNKREAMARLLIETLGIAPLFDTIVGADTAAAPKPDAAPVLMCMTRISAERGVFIGDSDTDIKAALAARMPCLIADFGYGPLTLAHLASAVFSDYAATAELVRVALDLR